MRGKRFLFRIGKVSHQVSMKTLFFIILILAALSMVRTFADSKPNDNNENIASIRNLEYDPPAPGSYRLPPIQKAVDGDVIDVDGKKYSLFNLFSKKYVILSFIYTTCIDAKGCPLATHVLNKIREPLKNDPSLAEKVLFITLSFDPEHDTPEVMRQYADMHGLEEARRDKSWRFLTTASKAEVQKILKGYGQYIVREYDSENRYTGGFTHVLKVYLIDPDRRVRNIYSTSFLYKKLIINDIKTLVMEKARDR